MRLTARIVLTLLFGWLGNTAAAALDPARSVTQYKHTKWTIDDGAPRAIFALAQGRSGYLWIGGSTGLYRFDGVSFAPIRRPDGKPLPSISQLLVSRNGDVWIGYTDGGSAMFSHGAVRQIPMPVSGYVFNMFETADGSIWATLGRNENQLLRYRDGRWQDVRRQFGFPVGQPTKTIVARDGTIWAAVITSMSTAALPVTTLWYLRPGAGLFSQVNATISGHAAVTEDSAGNIWLSDATGSRVAASRGKPVTNVGQGIYPSPTATRQVLTLFDRDGNLWGRADDSLYRIQAPRPAGASASSNAAAVSRFGPADGLLTGSTTALFEDLEGSIWVGSTLGLERFRDVRVVTDTSIINRAFWGDTLLRGSDGSVYVGEADAVWRIRPYGRPEVALRGKETQALCEGPDGAIWIVLQDSIARVHGRRVDFVPGPPDTQKNIMDCGLDQRQQFWVAALSRGLLSRVNGTWEQFAGGPRHDEYWPNFILQRQDRSMLVGFSQHSVALFNPPDALRPLPAPNSALGAIRTAIETRDGLLIGGQFGLGLVRGGQMQTLSSDRYPQFASVAGIVQTSRGQTWLSSVAGIVGMPTAKLRQAFMDPAVQLRPLVLDFRDGLMSMQSRDKNRAAVEGGGGRIWFSSGAGVVWIDPARMRHNSAAPPTAISAIKVGISTYLDPVRMNLPAGTSRVQLDYSALSLRIPERVQVRYKLVGADRGWIDPGTRRQAFYTNLQPGHYTFRVIAANDDGVWNRVGSRLDFDIPPTFLQSKWFLALCALGLVLLLVLAYRLRVRQLQANMRTLLEERLAERERIARDLHDTLLQGFQGLIFRFQSVANGMPKGTDRRSIEQALDSADDVLAEGRESVLHLRAAHATELPQALAAVAERLRETYPVEFDLVVEGEAHSLHPVAHEELSRIGEEALINAFKHASATKIELAIAYGAQALTLGIRDNGAGIPANVFAGGGRRGHFGLTGMRERAAQIDAQFDIASRPGAGTEISAIVPGRVAYAQHGKKRRGWWWRLVGSGQ